MDRKKTILMAVGINAGLLAVLFVAALFTQDEATLATQEMPSTVLEKPLFQEPVEIAVQESLPSNQIALPPLVQLPAQESKQLSSLPASAPEPLAHKLPPLAVENVPLPTPLPQEGWKEVTVKKGDSLEKIAKAHQTSVDEILKLNQLSSSFLKVGQVLKVHVGKTGAQASRAAQPKTALSSGPEYYIVKVGDNPWTIAMKHHMKVEELLKLNQLNEEKARKLKAGDRLRIR